MDKARLRALTPAEFHVIDYHNNPVEMDKARLRALTPLDNPLSFPFLISRNG